MTEELKPLNLEDDMFGYDDLGTVQTYRDQIEEETRLITPSEEFRTQRINVERGKVYTAGEKNLEDLEISYPGAHNCAAVGLYYALRYSGDDISLDEVRSVLTDDAGYLYSLAGTEYAIENLTLDDTSIKGNEYDMKFSRTSSVNPEIRNLPSRIDNRIEDIMEEIMNNKVVLLEMEETHRWRSHSPSLARQSVATGKRFESQERVAEEERHTVVICGFEINEKGVPIFYGFDSNVARSNVLRFEGRSMMKHSAQDYFAFKKAQKDKYQKRSLKEIAAD